MKRFKNDEFTVLGLNREKDLEKERACALELGMSYPVCLGMEDAFRAYWVNGIPCTVLIDQEGVLRGRFDGFGVGTEEELEMVVERLLRSEDK